MKIREATIEMAISLERNHMEDGVSFFESFRCENKELKAVVEKSLDFIANELLKDFNPKEKLDENDKEKVINYSKLETEEEKLMLLFNAATEGCAIAQHEIAEIYYDGKKFNTSTGIVSFAQNRPLSGMWEFLAAMNGHSYAQYNFAYCAAFSHGKYDFLGMSMGDGLKIMELAANQGNTNALYIVVDMFLNVKNYDFWEEFKNVEKGIKYAIRLREKGMHDYDDYIEKYRETGTI